MNPTLLISIFGTLTVAGIFWGGYNLGAIKTKIENHNQRLKKMDSNIKTFKKEIRSIPCSKVQDHLKE